MEELIVESTTSTVEQYDKDHNQSLEITAEIGQISSPESTIEDDKTVINTAQESIILPSSEEKAEDYGLKNKLALIGTQIILLLLLILSSVGYGWLHNLPNWFSPALNKPIEEYEEAIRNFDYVGLSVDNLQPSTIAILLEVYTWSLIGFLARSEYNLTKSTERKKKFEFLESVSKLIGNGAMSIAIAIAVVAFLMSTEFVNLSLRNAEIGSVIAISFILGFYHDDTRHLLGSFQKRIAGSTNGGKSEDDSNDA
jgi:hypothetical protein